jgi:hypothetical protein
MVVRPQEEEVVSKSYQPSQNAINAWVKVVTESALTMTKHERIMRAIHLSVKQEMRQSTLEEDLELNAIQAVRESLGELDAVRQSRAKEEKEHGRNRAS